jgi:hypothetical protein
MAAVRCSTKSVIVDHKTGHQICRKFEEQKCRRPSSAPALFLSLPGRRMHGLRNQPAGMDVIRMPVIPVMGQNTWDDTSAIRR